MNMIKRTISIICIWIAAMGTAQNSIDAVLQKYNSGSIPYISVEGIEDLNQNLTFLDAREQSEYEVSHIENAIYVGYDDFDITTVTENVSDKSTQIVVYCSIGVRSEDIAETLKANGYTNVYNLFGGIFEWKNKGRIVYNLKGEPTEKIHAYSEKWGKWLLKGIKIYD